MVGRYHYRNKGTKGTTQEGINRSINPTRKRRLQTQRKQIPIFEIRSRMDWPQN